MIAIGINFSKLKEYSLRVVRVSEVFNFMELVLELQDFFVVVVKLLGILTLTAKGGQLKEMQICHYLETES